MHNLYYSPKNLGLFFYKGLKMITVQPMGQKYGMVIEAGDDKVTFVFSQLTYFDRNKVSAASTFYKESKLMLDIGLAVFFNLKYALKDIKGLYMPSPSKLPEDYTHVEYKLEFEEGANCLTDNCVDEILALPFSDKLIYAARDLGANVPTKICDPVTGKEVLGVEVIPPEKLTGLLEKK